MCCITQGGQGKQCGHFHGTELLKILLANFASDILEQVASDKSSLILKIQE
jgi:hypothetical protein